METVRITVTYEISALSADIALAECLHLVEDEAGATVQSIDALVVGDET